MDPVSPVVELFYSGHGATLSGDWCFENSSGKVTDYITFEEITDMWRRARGSKLRKMLLYLNLDCCFAGQWVKKAEQLSDATIVIRASCGDTQVSLDTSSGGAFTKALVQAVSENSEPTVSQSRNKQMAELLSGKPLNNEQTPCFFRA